MGTSSSAGDVWQDLRLRLKSDLCSTRLGRTALVDDYDLYFRDTWFVLISEKTIYIGATNPMRTQEGLRKYANRLRRLTEVLFGVALSIDILSDHQIHDDQERN